MSTMPDAVTVLRSSGILIPDVMVRAAQMENVDLAVAAAILEGESGGGKNIWGADGGLNVRTNGTYRPRTTVTREAYLAYRVEMRAKRIIRQGAGPCQCTSAQYQDTADALGGTWDPLANCRSGFRGMGALIRAYGVRGGSRRYNGAGAPAEAYADRFVARYERWRARLSGVSVPAVAVPAAPVVAASKGLPDMIERRLVKGLNEGRIICPTGSVSDLVAAAWVSVSAKGGVKGRVLFQRSADSDGAPPGSGGWWDVAAKNAARPYEDIPSGTEYIEYTLTAAGEGSLLIEQKPK